MRLFVGAFFRGVSGLLFRLKSHPISRVPNKKVTRVVRVFISSAFFVAALELIESTSRFCRKIWLYGVIQVEGCIPEVEAKVYQVKARFGPPSG